jgi:RNA 2',3'-cyclic 3'-phosphodiesterase
MPRLFFALWPHPEVQQKLASHALQLAQRTDGRASAVQNIHMTLAFLGDTPEHLLVPLLDLRARFAALAFSIEIDRIGALKHGIVYAAPSEPPASLRDLVADLQTELKALGLVLEQRAFKPHLTLVRKALRSVAALRIDPIPWDVNGVALVRSELSRSGSTYRLLER